MSNPDSRRLPKWPFFVADVVLSSLAAFTLHACLPAAHGWQVALCVASLAAAALGAWLWIKPFLVEYDTETERAETTALTTAVEQIQYLALVGEKVQTATGHWQSANEASAKAVAAAREVSDKMAAEARDFIKFFEQAGNQEKNFLRLEVEKAKRSEGEWLQVTVRILDHIYALHTAGQRSGQASLMTQLEAFQNACREIARRVGLAVFVPSAGDSFDPNLHQMGDPQAVVHPGDVLLETFAPGYSYQGQVLRRALVKVGLPSLPQLAVEDQPSEPQPAPQAPADAAPDPSPEAIESSQPDPDPVAEQPAPPAEDLPTAPLPDPLLQQTLPI